MEDYAEGETKDTLTVSALLKLEDLLNMDTIGQQLHNNGNDSHQLTQQSSSSLGADSYHEGTDIILSPMKSSQHPQQKQEFSNKIIEFDLDQQIEIMEYLSNNKHKDQLIKVRISEQKIHYFHASFLRFAIQNGRMHVIKHSNSQNFVQDEQSGIFEMLKLLQFNVNLGHKDVQSLCKTKQSIIYKVGDVIAKQALIKDDYSLDLKISLLLNSVYQAQMHMLESRLEVQQCFYFDKNSNLQDFVWGIQGLKVLSDQTQCTQEQQERIIFLSIQLIAAEYHQNNIVHCDIKPANIFFDDEQFIMTADNGSIMYLGKPKEDEEEAQKFLLTCYSEKYASPDYIEAIKNQTPLTRVQLLNEDKYQLKQTLNFFLHNQKKYPPSQMCKQIVSYFDDEKISICEIYKQIYSQFDILIQEFSKQNKDKKEPQEKSEREQE